MMGKPEARPPKPAPVLKPDPNLSNPNQKGQPPGPTRTK
jgi:hypothetical protein